MDRIEVLMSLREIYDADIVRADSLLRAANLDLDTEPDRVREWLEDRANSNVAAAQHVLSKLLLVGLVGDRDPTAAFIWCQKAVEQGDVPAMVLLSTFLSDDLGGAVRDEQRAVALLRDASGRGSTVAHRMLSTSFEKGLGVPRDAAQAKFHLELAAIGGDPLAQLALGERLIVDEERSVVLRGVDWLHASAKQDIAGAHRALERIYSTGLKFVTVDYERARFHSGRAAALERKPDR